MKLDRLSILLRAELGTVSSLSFVYVGRKKHFMAVHQLKFLQGVLKYTILTDSSHFVFLHQTQVMCKLDTHVKQRMPLGLSIAC